MKKGVLLCVLPTFFLITSLLSGERDAEQNITNNDIIIKVTFIAKDKSVLTAVFDNASSTVIITMNNGKTFTLHRALSASGARYAEKEEKIVFWTKGENASLWINDQLIFSGTVKEN
jgi:membrane-bound inhibitor of C-type lysozyme